MSRRVTRFRVDADFLIQRVVLAVQGVQGWTLDERAFILYRYFRPHSRQLLYSDRRTPIGIADESLVDITWLLSRVLPRSILSTSIRD